MKFFILLVITLNVFANRGRNDTTPDSMTVNNLDSYGNLDIRNNIKSLNIGDSLQLESLDEYILRTNQRIIHLKDYSLIEKFNKLRDEILESKNIQSEIFGEVSSKDIITELNISVKPFDVDDF